jgi:hypothetical protein
MADLDPAGEERRQRNLRIAVYGGALLLPLAGILGALAFYARGERSTAARVAWFAAIGAALYVVLFLVT